MEVRIHFHVNTNQGVIWQLFHTQTFAKLYQNLTIYLTNNVIH